MNNKKRLNIVRMVSLLLSVVMICMCVLPVLPVSAATHSADLVSMPITKDDTAVFYLSNADGSVVFKYTISGFKGTSPTDIITAIGEGKYKQPNKDELMDAALNSGYTCTIPKEGTLEHNWNVEVVKGNISASAAPRISKIEIYPTSVAARTITYKDSNGNDIRIESNPEYEDTSQSSYNCDTGEIYWGISIQFTNVNSAFNINKGWHLDSTNVQAKAWNGLGNTVNFGAPAYHYNRLYKANNTWDPYQDKSTCLTLPIFAGFKELIKNVTMSYKYYDGIDKKTAEGSRDQIRIIGPVDSLNSENNRKDGGTMTLNSQLYSFGGLTWEDLINNGKVQVENDVPVYVLSSVRNTYNIEYVSNGGLGSASSSTVQYGSSFTLSNGFSAPSGYETGYYYTVIRKSDQAVFCKDGKWHKISEMANNPNSWCSFSPGSTQIMNNGWLEDAVDSVGNTIPYNASDDTFIFYAQWKALPGKYDVTTKHYLEHSNGSAAKWWADTHEVKTYGSTAQAQWASDAALATLNNYYIKDIKGYDAYGNGSIVDNPWTVTANGSFLALYKPKQVTVVFHRNTSASDTVTQMVTYATDAVEQNGESIRYFALPNWSNPGYNMTRYSEKRDGTLTTSKYDSYLLNTYALESPVGAWWVRNVYDTEPTHTVHLYMQWEKASYKVTYDYTTNGGTSWNGGTSSKVMLYNNSVNLSYSATKSGWTFVGWNTDPNATTALTSYTMPSRDVTLYAIYKKSITLTFTDAQGTQTKSNTIYNTATSASFTAPSVRSKSGWSSRGGWSTGTAASAGMACADGATLTASSDTTYYGLYSKTVVLSYDTHGGSSVSSQTATAYHNAAGNTSTCTFTVASAPTKSGYNFGTWHLGSESGTAYAPGNSYSTSDSVTMHATWTTANASYKVVHYKQNANDDNYTLADTNTGLSGVIGSAPSYTAKSYAGFWYDSSLTSAPVIAADGSTVVKLYYKRNTHKLTVEKGTGIADAWTSGGSIRYGQTVNMGATVSSGYNWSGWTGYEGKSEQSFTFTMPDCDVTFRANGTKASFNVTYDYTTNGGTSWNGGTSPKSVLYSSSVNLSYTATKSGWTFVGWNTDKNATSGLTSYSMPASNVTLYAIYKKSITVTYKDYNNNSVSTNKTETKTIYNTATSATFTAPSVRNGLSGWTSRGGWSFGTAADASVAYSDGGTISLSSNATLYGLYRRTVTLSYNGNGATSTPAAQTGNYAYRSASGNVKGYEFTLAGALTFTGYTFEKWHLGSLSGTAYNAGAKYTTSSDVTMYAGKTANTYTVRLYMNKPSNASGTVSKTTPSGWVWNSSEGGYYYRTFTYDDANGTLPSLSSVYTSLTGWTGRDWNTTRDGSGTKYTSGTKAWNFTATNDGIVKLYATWTANRYVIRIHTTKPTNALSDIQRTDPAGWSWSDGGYYETLFTYDMSSTIPTADSVFRLTEYVISGWFSNSACAGDVISGTAVWNLTNVNNGIVDLYSSWVDVTGPRITVTPTKTTNESADNNAVKNVNVCIKIDEGGAGLASSNAYDYGFSTSMTVAPSEWRKYSNTTGVNGFTVTLPEMGKSMDGYYYLWVKQIKDRSGNASTSAGASTISQACHVYGVYVFDNTAPIGTVKYVENNTMLGLYDGSAISNPYAVISVGNASDAIAGINKLKLIITDVTDSSNKAEFELTKSGGVYSCTFNLYNCLVNASNVERVTMKVIAIDKVGNAAILPVTQYDFGKKQDGTPIRDSDVGFIEVTDEMSDNDYDGVSTDSDDDVYYIRDAFRVEAAIHDIMGDTQFAKGQLGMVDIYTFGGVETIAVDFGSLNNYVNVLNGVHLPEYQWDATLDLATTVVNHGKTGFYTHKFYAPLYAAESTYTDTVVTGTKGSKKQFRKLVFSVSGTILDDIKTILKYGTD